MSGKQTVITILGVAAIAGCTWSFNAWLDQQSFNKKSEFDAKLSEQETARYQMIKDLASEVVSLERSKEAREGTLGASQSDSLQKGEWPKAPLYSGRDKF